MPQHSKKDIEALVNKYFTTKQANVNKAGKIPPMIILELSYYFKRLNLKSAG